MALEGPQQTTPGTDAAKPPAKIKVLYLHGFEETPDSPKPKLLTDCKDLDVLIPSLEVYPTRRNGFVVNLLTNKWLWASLASGLLVTPFTVFMSFPMTIGIGISVAATIAQRQALMKDTVQGSLETTYDIALNSLQEFKPDVVVGFSWGGCLASILLKKKEWSGPTVLLGPAYEKLLTMLGNEKTKQIEFQGRKFDFEEPIFEDFPEEDAEIMKKQVKVVAGGEDSIVPPDDMKAWCEKNEFELKVVPGEEHKLWGFKELPQFVINLWKATKSNS